MLRAVVGGRSKDPPRHAPPPLLLPLRPLLLLRPALRASKEDGGDSGGVVVEIRSGGAEELSYAEVPNSLQCARCGEPCRVVPRATEPDRGGVCANEPTCEPPVADCGLPCSVAVGALLFLA